jgi:hypothetical protein
VSPLKARAPNSPKGKSEAKPSVIMGERGERDPVPAPDPRLEAALARLWQGIRQSRGGGSGEFPVMPSVA